MRSLSIIAASLAALAGCQSLQSSDNLLGIITPYKVEVVQGNVVTQEQAAAVKPGMSRNQVRDILGSPLKYPHNDDRTITTRVNLVNLGDAQLLTIPGEAPDAMPGSSETISSALLRPASTKRDRLTSESAVTCSSTSCKGLNSGKG